MIAFVSFSGGGVCVCVWVVICLSHHKGSLLALLHWELAISSKAGRSPCIPGRTSPWSFGLRVSPCMLELMFCLFPTDLPCSGLCDGSSILLWTLDVVIPNQRPLSPPKGRGIKNFLLPFQTLKGLCGAWCGPEVTYKGLRCPPVPCRLRTLAFRKGGKQLSMNRVPGRLMPLFI